MRSLRPARLAAAAFALVLLSPGTAAAWGDTGHHAIGQVAYKLMRNSDARAKVDAILGSGGHADPDPERPGRVPYRRPG